MGRLAIRREGPGQLAIFHVDRVDRVKGLEDLLVLPQPEGAQEDRPQKLALAVDAHVQDVLLVVLELHPAAAVRNDLAQEVGTVVGGLKEHTGRTVQLRNDHAFGPVHDEGAVGAHQRNVAEEHLLLLHVAQTLQPRFSVLVVDLQADGDLERSGVGHPALLALSLVVLQLQTHRVTALGAEVRRVLVVRAAELAQHIAGMERVGDHHVSAGDAGRPQMIQPLQVAAVALPVADRVIHKLQFGDVAEICNRKHGGKHRLQAVVLALLRQLVHLQEPLIRAALDLDQVWNLDAGGDLGKIETGANRARFGCLSRHTLSWCGRGLETTSARIEADTAETIISREKSPG